MINQPNKEQNKISIRRIWDHGSSHSEVSLICWHFSKEPCILVGEALPLLHRPQLNKEHNKEIWIFLKDNPFNKCQRWASTHCSTCRAAFVGGVSRARGKLCPKGPWRRPRRLRLRCRKRAGSRRTCTRSSSSSTDNPSRIADTSCCCLRTSLLCAMNEKAEILVTKF